MNSMSITNDLLFYKRNNYKLKDQYFKFQHMEKYYKIILENLNEGIWHYNSQDRSIFYSDRCMEILGYKTEVIKNISDFEKIMYFADLKRLKSDYFKSVFKKITEFNVEYRIKDANRKYKWINIRCKIIYDKSGKVIEMTGSMTDVTQEKLNEQSIKKMAYYDPLTGLPNINLLNDKIAKKIHNLNSNRTVAILSMDLDNFKSISDLLGHYLGDKLFIKISKILRENVPRNFILARVTGDEFALLVDNVNKITDIIDVINKIMDALSHPIVIMQNKMYITISIGVSIYPKDGKEADTLLRNANTAMYYAKKLGRGNYRFFSDDMNDMLSEKLKMQNNLRHAIENDEFIVYYQPKVDIKTGKVKDAEALVRWMNSEGKIVCPDEFIPAAEESNLIVKISHKVLETVCVQNKIWSEKGYRPIKISINLSAKQFEQKDFIDNVRKILQDTNMNPHYLEFEITESIALKDFNYVILVLNEIHKMGIDISLDDFGKGYSSLNYLENLPIDVLKIDKSFIDDITANPNKQVISKSLISMAHYFNLTVVAEGVEKKGQIDFLKKENCDLVQGYFFSKPVPPDEFEVFLEKKEG